MTVKISTPPAPPRTPRDVEAAREREERIAVWGFLWILFGFKIATVLLIAWADRTAEAALLLTATTWYFLPLPVVAVAGVLLFRYRLVKVRRRREQLRRAEWLLDDAPSHPPTIPH